MKLYTFLAIALFTGSAFLTPISAAATQPAVYTNENFFTLPHDAPKSFSQDSLGNFSGVTLSGKTFRQTRIVFDISVRLQLFTIDEARFYISSEGIIQADNDLAALSIYLTQVGWVG